MSDPEFDEMLEKIMSSNNRTGRIGFKVPAGPSIIELIEKERDASKSWYREGLTAALDIIEEANRTGGKPFYALKKGFGHAQALGNSDFTRGFKTAIFIFETPYKWIAGERP